MSNTQSFNHSSAALWASALVIAAMVIVQAGRLPSNSAHAEMATNRGDYSVLSGSSGLGGEVEPHELIYVIDSRTEVLMVYDVEDARKKQIILRSGGSLNNLFRNAR